MKYKFFLIYLVIYGSDNGSAMIKTFSEIKDKYNNNIVHIRCFAHILNLVAKALFQSEGFAKITEFIQSWHKLSKKSSKFKNSYFYFLKSRNMEAINLPKFVETICRLTGLEAAFFAVIFKFYAKIIKSDIFF